MRRIKHSINLNIINGCKINKSNKDKKQIKLHSEKILLPKFKRINKKDRENQYSNIKMLLDIIQ